MRKVEAAVLERQHLGADGVLGTDSLGSQNVLFDFKNGILSITPTARRAPRDEEGTIVVEARRRAGRLIITEADANGRKLSVVIDTGAEVSIGNEALRQALLTRRQLRPNGTVELQSVSGEVLKGDYLTLKELRLGEVILRDLNIVFADAHTFRQMNLEEKPALLLGMNAIRAFDKVSIDFARKKLRVVMPKGSEADSATRMAMR
jgi:predicted aspartyl protease